jgi:putative membrane protein insertion efficiency factor
VTSFPPRARRSALLAVACLALLFGWDVSRAPGAQRSAAAAITAIHFYERAVSPLVRRSGVRCRFAPTCSRYAEVAIERHGLIGGGWRAAKRLARCGPWTPMGTLDPPDPGGHVLK